MYYVEVKNFQIGLAWVSFGLLLASATIVVTAWHPILRAGAVTNGVITNIDGDKITVKVAAVNGQDTFTVDKSKILRRIK